MKKILTVGAYERDNFGDALFFLIAERMFAQSAVTAAGLVFADMRSLIGHPVYPYNRCLADEKWDLVLVVGGELGAVDVDHALRMVLTKQQEAVFRAMANPAPIRLAMTGRPENETAYLVDMANFPLNADTPLYVHSVGLGRLGEIGPHALVHATKPILARAAGLSVRDRQSMDWLASIGLAAQLAPDIVHALYHYFPAASFPCPLEGVADYIACQFSEAQAAACGEDRIAARLTALAERLSKPVVFVAAGLANYHDSLSVYESVAERMGRLSSRIKVVIHRRRSPGEIVGVIRHAGLWLGTSLHGRVVAIASAVPRVSLSNTKVRAYAMLWDARSPYDVDIDDIDAAADHALAVAHADLVESAHELQRLAMASSQQLFGDLLA